MATDRFIQEDAVADLKKSKQVVGELTPVIKDQYGRIIAGEHRTKAGWKKVVVVKVKDDLEFQRLRIHYNVQRQLPLTEWATMFDLYAQTLERAGWRNPDIVKELLRVSHFGKQYAYNLIPDRYKSDEGRPRKLSLASGETQFQEGSVFGADGTEFGVKEAGEKTGAKNPTGPCPCCDPPKMISLVGGRFRLAAGR